MNTLPSIDVILPRYNETKEVVLDTIKKIEEFFKINNFRVNFILSQNGPFTPLSFENKSNLISLHTPEAGLGFALKNAANKCHGDYFFFTSPDNPFSFTDLAKMISNKDDFDLIFGSKLHKGSIYQAPILRRIFSFLQHLFTIMILPKFHVLDPNGTIWGNKITLEQLKNCKSNDYFIGTELAWKMITKNARVCEVPVVYEKKDNKTTVNILQYAISNIRQIWNLKNTNS